ncbi:MAG: hypothetical protein Q8781_01850 [Candidatus Phytoplasma stylosanthis]|uniref:hypothetical protein n=1 Tax=Candidatus Phytoplasma stylosanthis TaxID=2798314 RepID=UPI00293AED5C|nr:hypothetical protein [Candidatus Phytoplasma stylosanthis]MDV3167936.1 hypothetical protein [Candidatus Phytoplasma stylosanthis]MDV3171029.1 hypothetical protein [Candidatus Phytoplasma stylosanthis]MDV3173841.1 hypothetical protein [Candidatus Phytoplasma stylosanthis]MDV3174249.1 hypothetical protein [Candidatus Phytoplasma stylosanthis]MDV3202694.1 hypothetical protein [Candidatus Phytoplasma stylosanthis]
MLKVFHKYEDIEYSFMNYAIEIIKFEIRELIIKSYIPSNPQRKVKEEIKTNNEEFREEIIPLTFSKDLKPSSILVKRSKT